MENIITTYAPETDMTFILEDTPEYTRVVGFYYGHPDEESTRKFIGSIEARY